MIDPVANTPVTICVGSDRYAGHVVKRLSPKRITVTYDYKNNDEDVGIWSQRKDGVWRPKGADRSHGMRLVIGVAEDYLDPHF